MEEKSLLEAIEILKGIEGDLDGIAWGKTQTGAAIRSRARIDERYITPRLRKTDRERLVEVNADLAMVSAAFRGIGRARQRLERFHDWLISDGPVVVARPNGNGAAKTPSAKGAQGSLPLHA